MQFVASLESVKCKCEMVVLLVEFFDICTSLLLRVNVAQKRCRDDWTWKVANSANAILSVELNCLPLYSLPTNYRLYPICRGYASFLRIFLALQPALRKFKCCPCAYLGCPTHIGRESVVRKSGEFFSYFGKNVVYLAALVNVLGFSVDRDSHLLCLLCVFLKEINLSFYSFWN